MNLSNLAFTLGSWANHLPALWRKRVYTAVKYLSGALTVFLLVAPALPQVGVNFDPNDRWTALATAVLAFLSHMASRNTVVPDQVDVTSAPEVHPADAAAAPAEAPAAPSGTETPAAPETPAPFKTNPSG